MYGAHGQLGSFVVAERVALPSLAYRGEAELDPCRVLEQRAVVLARWRARKPASNSESIPTDVVAATGQPYVDVRAAHETSSRPRRSSMRRPVRENRFENVHVVRGVQIVLTRGRKVAV